MPAALGDAPLVEAAANQQGDELSLEDLARRVLELPDTLDQERAVSLLVEAYKGMANGEATTRLSFRDFIAEISPRYHFYRHCEELIAVLQRVADGELKRVMIFMPPRHSKSETASRLFTAYYLYCHPDHWVGVNSYSADLAYTLSRAARENFTRAGGELSSDASAVKHWETTGAGGLWAAGVGGAITGKGFHVGIVDDPLKNAEEAQSEVIRSKIMDWWDSTFYTRAEPDAAIVVIQTRWHTMDLSGALLARERDEAEHWYVVNMPALAESVDIQDELPPTCTRHEDWREEGEALCPERYTKEALERIMRRNAYVWTALYQQRPSISSGNRFKTEMFCPPNDKGEYKGDKFWPLEMVLSQPIREAYFAWDTAAKTKAKNDFTAGGIACQCADGFIYLLPIVLRKMEVPEVERTILTQWARWWRILNSVPKSLGCVKGCHVEEGASGGTAIVQHARLLKPLQKQVGDAWQLWQQSGNDPSLFDWKTPAEWIDHLEDWKMVVTSPPANILPHQPDRVATEIKANDILSFCAGRNVRLVEGAVGESGTNCSYARPWLGQLLALPLGDHDDAVDTTIKLVRPYAGVVDGESLWSAQDIDDAVMDVED